MAPTLTLSALQLDKLTAILMRELVDTEVQQWLHPRVTWFAFHAEDVAHMIDTLRASKTPILDTPAHIERVRASILQHQSKGVVSV